MGRLRRALAATVAMAAVAPATAGAAMRWSEPDTLSPGTPGDVALDARGDVLAVFHRASESRLRSFYTWRPPRGRWTEPRELEGANGRVAMTLSPLGHATAAWNDGRGRIVAAEARPGRAFDRPEVVVSGIGSSNSIDLATDDAGNALLAWSYDTRSGRQNAGSTIFVATRRAGGAWSEPQDVSGDVSGGGPFVAMNPAGAAAVAWITIENGLPHVAYRHPAGSFGSPERVPIPGPSFPLQLALDESGRAYMSGPENVLGGGPVRTVLSVRSALGGWTDPTELARAGGLTTLLVEPSGHAHVLMDRTGANGREVALLTRRPDGSTSDVVVAEGRTGSTGAMNLRGDILAAWEHPLEGDATGPIEAAIRPPGGPFSDALAISDPDAVQPRVALNDAGQAAAMWALGGYANPSAQVAVREDPKLPTLPFPPGVDVDVPGTPRLDGDGDLVLAVRCSRECTAKPRGVVVPGGEEKPASGEGKTRRLRSGRRGTLTVDFGTAAARAVRRALRAGRKPAVHVSVRARGSSPRPVTFSRRVRLR